MALTHVQRLLLMTLAEHAGGNAIGNEEIDRELNRRHNRHMGYDGIHSALRRMAARGWVEHDSHRPMRWKITEEGKKVLG